MINSRAKGKRGELLFVKEAKKYGFECRRGQQYSGIGGEDVVGLEGIWVEVKHGENINVREAIAQALADARSHYDKTLDCRLPIVALKRKYKSWKIIMRLPDLANLYSISLKTDLPTVLVEMESDDWFKVYKNWLKEIKH